MSERFDDKESARRAVWDRLQAEKVARFPFPPHGRIPNFAGARQAARRLFELEPWKSARSLKVNPDSPQRHVREEALRRGVTLYVPTPRLHGGFKRFDPRRIPEDKIPEAASLSRGGRWAAAVALEDMPAVDAIVAGSVAVTRDGRRAGKGAGYSDLEFAILRELGHPPVPVATTVHPLQIVAALPAGPNDLPLAAIATPEEAVEVAHPPPPPERIAWEHLSAGELEEMPVLKDLKELKARRAG